MLRRRTPHRSPRGRKRAADRGAVIEAFVGDDDDAPSRILQLSGGALTTGMRLVSVAAGAGGGTEDDPRIKLANESHERVMTVLESVSGQPRSLVFRHQRSGLLWPQRHLCAGSRLKGMVVVQLLHGSELPRMDRFCNYDSYVRVSLLGRTKASSLKPKGAPPSAQPPHAHTRTCTHTCPPAFACQRKQPFPHPHGVRNVPLSA